MSWEFLSIRTIKARKSYSCIECRCAIEPGTLHVYTAGKCEGDFQDYRLCIRCNDLAQAYCSEFDGAEGWPLGDLHQECIDESGFDDLDAWLVHVREKRDAKKVPREIKAMSAERRALYMAASHCQGGHSDAGQAIAAALGVPFPLSMTTLVEKAALEGAKPLDLWPWLASDPTGRLGRRARELS